MVGPTGCGKSTLLNVAAGLLQPSAGSVRGVRRAARRHQLARRLHVPGRGADALAQRPRERHRGPRVPRRRPRGGAGAGAGLADARRASPASSERYPHQLSGGMRKRVALAQMLILDPQILLMDEPFSALDIQTRQLMENELLELWGADRKSVVFITHDLEEAISLSDRVVVLSAGPASHPIGDYRDRPAAAARRRRDTPRAALHRAARPDLACDEGRSAERAMQQTDTSEWQAAPEPALLAGAFLLGTLFVALAGADEPGLLPPIVCDEPASRGVLLRRAAEGARGGLGVVLRRRDLRAPLGDAASRPLLAFRHRHRARGWSSDCGSRSRPRPPRSFDPYIKAVNAMPRVILAPIFLRLVRPRHRVEGGARRDAGVLHRVLQRLPGRAAK